MKDKSIDGPGLLPCPNPWCRRASLPKLYHDPDTKERQIYCPSCGVEGPERDTEAEAIVAWETRSNNAPALVEALQEAQSDLDMLRTAVEASDPQAELLVRVTDIWKRIDAVLSTALGEMNDE